MQRANERRWALWAAIVAWAAAAACTVESPASTPQTSTPAKLFRHETLEQAWRAAVLGKRPLVVMFTSDQCPHCERMLAETYGHPVLFDFLVRHAETALAHADDYQELAAKLRIRGYPTTLIVSADGQIVDAVEGFVDAPTFARRAQRWIGPQAASVRAQPPVNAVAQ
jgi:thioredoxin-related protein